MAATSTKALPPDETLYRPPTDPIVVDVPAFDFRMIDGRGDPNTSPEYAVAIQALYSTSYPVVMALKRAGAPGLKVRPLEGLWWADDVRAFDPATEDRAAWRWTMMIRQPDDVPEELYATATANAAKKVGGDTAGRLRVERFEEGRCAQLMHVGPYAEEGPNIERLHQFVAAQGLALRGHHHEIYLSDPRRCAPAKLRTVIRHPVGPATAS